MNAILSEKKGKYYVLINYTDDSNKRIIKWISTGLDTSKGNKRKAEEIRMQKLEEFKKDYAYRMNPESDVLFADFIQDWLARSKDNLQESSYGSYQLQVKAISKYFREKGIKLLDLRPVDISNYYIWLENNGKSIQVREHFHVNIRKCLQTAVKADLIPSNPADKIDRPRSPKHTAKFYNAEMLKELFKKIKGDRLAYIYRITAIYGLRRSEMLGLRWKNIDFNKNMILICHSMVQTRINGKSVIVEKDRMKNQSSLRSLPLLPVVKDMLIAEKNQQEINKKNYGKFYSPKYEELVCVDEIGERIKPDTVSSHFRMLLERYNLPIINFHELRHSCASLLLSMGISMKEIQSWLGHSTYETTANIYSHLDATSKFNTATALVEMFGNANDKQKQIRITEKAKNDVENIRQIESKNLKNEFNKYQKEMESTEDSEDIDDEIAMLELQIQKKKLERLKKKNESEM